jgi:ribonuclease D
VQDIITRPADLEHLAGRLAATEAIGLDTEFLRERTYRAELCLLQIADPAGPLCVDPLALEDLGPLVGVLSAPQPVKIMHASRQDIEVLFPAVGLVQPIFDTQIAAALTGLPAQIGYGELVKRLLNHELSKAHTRTDWSRRPLSGEQVAYALDDVRYLLPLHAQLTAQIAQLGRTQWLSEELAALCDPRGYAIDPEQAWQRLKGLRGLDPARTRVARALAAWRERRAIERNRPRGWILDDATLREIVNQVPRTLAELAAIGEIPVGVVKHSGAEILECIRGADVPERLAPTAPRARPDPHKAAVVKQLSAIHQAVAAELHLTPEVLATRRDLEQLAEGERAVPVLGGWRREVIGKRLLAAL